MRKALCLTLILNCFVIFVMIFWIRNNVNWTFKPKRDDENILYKIKFELDKLIQKEKLNQQIRGNNMEISFKKPASNPLLVIFTTFNVNSFHHIMAHRLVISNWGSLGDLIKPVLFENPNSTKSEFEKLLIKTAIEKGWDVLSLKSTNPHGTPHLKPMYKEIFKKYNASFYGYANGDLMFTDELLKSLQYLKSILKDKLNNNVLLVGRRTDIQLNLNETLGYAPEANRTINDISPENIQSLENYFNKSNLPILAKNGVLRGIFAIDYFFFTRENSTFNWSAIANVVIGRRAYDQYLIAMAIRMKVCSIDMSRHILAAHLSKPGFPDTGFLPKDKDYNFKAIGGHFPYNDGLTSATTYFLHKNASSFVIVKRQIVKKN